jgi:hypothetical protein
VPDLEEESADAVPDLEEEEWADAVADLEEQESADTVADLEEWESANAVADLEEEPADAVSVALERRCMASPSVRYSSPLGMSRSSPEYPATTSSTPTQA